MKIVSVAQMRALEAAAFAAGSTEAALQARAAQTVAEEVLRLVQPGERVVVLVGHGNNGRDGALAAGLLAGHGTPVDLVLSPRHAVTPAEVVALEAGGVSIVQSDVERALRGARLAVDGLAGIGTHGPLREPLATLVNQVNAADLPVLAIDVPSGIDADTGDVPGEAVWADTTVTLGGVKQGLLRFPAAERVGTLIAREIGIPPQAEAGLPYTVLDRQRLGRLVPSRPLDAHKYRFGRVLVVAGADHFLGAPVLCSGAAARVGAGLVTVASSREVRLNTAAHLPEVTFTAEDVRAADGVRVIAPYLESHTAVVIGPGLGRGDDISSLVGDLLGARPHNHRLVVDADGLVALAEMENWPARLGPNAVLTPHAGELERLVGHALSSDEPLWVHAGRLAAEWGCVLVAKGPFTCIASPDGQVDVWPLANPALATGGTGDVLAGATAGLLAQNIPVWDASRLAVGIHGLAARHIVESRGWRTLLASDLLVELPAALGSLAR